MSECFQNSFAEVAGFVSVAQLDGLVFARGCAGGNRGAADGAAFDVDVGFDRGIAARIYDFTTANAGDLCGHSVS
jgi:hypothetical protein